MSTFKNKVIWNLLSIPGWRTKRKLIIIESDDWGSIRMPSKHIFNQLLEKGVAVDKDPYTKYDSLETSEDLEALFEVLSSFRDKNGNHPIITANYIVANPDFELIAKHNFQKYFYRTTEKEYARTAAGLQLALQWKQGIENRFLLPQFHGREHVNTTLWLEALKQNSYDFDQAFKLGVFGISSPVLDKKRNNFMASFDWYHEQFKTEHKSIVREGLSLFKDQFGFASKTMIAPCYIWYDAIEEAATVMGVELMQGISYQYIPTGNGYKKRFHYTGQKNKYGQFYSVRNCFFEPTLNPGMDVIDECLKRIEIAFRYNKSVIIGTHRINFMGSLILENRELNLKKFQKLLGKILKTWPEVEFVSSADLGNLMKQEK